MAVMTTIEGLNDLDNKVKNLESLLKGELSNDHDEELKLKQELIENYSHVQLLQRCCEYDLFNVANWLLTNYVFDLTGTVRYYGLQPLDIACDRSGEKLIELVLTKLCENITEGNKHIIYRCICESLCTLIKRIGATKLENHFENSIRLFIEKIKANNINTEEFNDDFDVTPLFYAQYYELPDLQALLLETVYLAGKSDNIMILDKVDPSILEKHLDNLIRIDKNQNRTDIQINYKALCRPEKTTFSETEVFFEISSRKKFQYLLLHPVILVFLFLKWHNIKVFTYYYWAKFALWIILAIFWCFCSFANNFLKDYVLVVGICHIIIIIIIIIYVFMIISHFEFNSRELLVLTWPIPLSICITFMFNHWLVKPLLAIATMVLSLKIILLLRIYSKYGEIFQVVMCNFIKLLLWHFPIIIPFTLSYHDIFSQKQNATDDSLPTLVGSFYNVFTLLGAQFSFNDFSGEYPTMQKICSIVFIFIFSIVLINLLTSQAVADLQKLKNNADIICIKEKIQFIYSTENLLESLFRNYSRLANFINKYCISIKNSKIFENNGSVLKVAINRNESCPKYIYLDKKTIKSLNKIKGRDLFVYLAALDTEPIA